MISSSYTKNCENWIPGRKKEAQKAEVTLGVFKEQHQNKSREPLCSVGWWVNRYSNHGKQYEGSLKKPENRTTR